MCYLFKYFFFFGLRYPFEFSLIFFLSMMMKLGLHSNGVIGWIVCRLDNICMGISALVIDEMVMNICTNDDLMNKSEHAQHIT